MPARFAVAIALIMATAAGAQTFRCPSSVWPEAKWANQVEENGVRLVRWAPRDEQPNAQLSQISVAKDAIYCTFIGPTNVSTLYLVPKKLPADFSCFDVRMSLLWPDHIGSGGEFALDRQGAKEKRARFTGTRGGPPSSDVRSDTCRYTSADPLKGATYRFEFTAADSRCTNDSNVQVTCR